VQRISAGGGGRERPARHQLHKLATGTVRKRLEPRNEHGVLPRARTRILCGARCARVSQAGGAQRLLTHHRIRDGHPQRLGRRGAGVRHCTVGCCLEAAHLGAALQQLNAQLCSRRVCCSLSLLELAYQVIVPGLRRALHRLMACEGRTASGLPVRKLLQILNERLSLNEHI